MESKETATPIRVKVTGNEHMTALTFPNREPFVIWDFATLNTLIYDLMYAASLWKEKK